jgi:hypothetical protein
MQKKPNFFIIGAPKSGTTSLYKYLAQHPNVFMSKTKEPCFLAPDFYSPLYPQTEEEYLKLFEGWNYEDCVGEATTTYLYSRKAAKSIKEYSPEAKIIAILRNPVEMVHALHGQRVVEGNENIFGFEDALDAEDLRRIGKKLPSGFKYPPEYLLYRDFGLYSTQLERYFEIFNKDNVKILLFDDLKASPLKVYCEVLKFLGISTDHRPILTIEKSGRFPKNPRLNFIMKRCRFAASFINMLSLKKIIPKTLIKKRRNYLLSSWEGCRPILSEKLINSLQEYYREEISNLSDLLNINLNEKWIKF